MATIDQFRILKSSLTPNIQSELYECYVLDPDMAMNKIISLALEKGISVSKEEAKKLISEMDSDDDFDDIELTASTLSAMTGGARGGGGGS
jgi:hypothetical protein